MNFCKFDAAFNYPNIGSFILRFNISYGSSPHIISRSVIAPVALVRTVLQETGVFQSVPQV